MKTHVIIVLIGFFVVTSCRRQPPLYDKIDAMLPMRDGVRLNTEIYIPKNAPERLPLLLLRSAYGVPKLIPPWVTGLEELATDGYIFVFQDIRGRFKSEGQFVMLRPLRDKGDPGAIDESTDTYDTIEWLTKNVRNNNGRAGVFGVSYSGWLTMMAC